MNDTIILQLDVYLLIDHEIT